MKGGVLPPGGRRSKLRPKNLEIIYPPYDLILNFDFHFVVFLAVILVPELFKKLRETPGNNSHQVSSKSELMGPSYDQKTENFNE